MVPIAPPEPDSTGTSAKYHQTFKILDSAAPISDQTISLDYPLNSVSKVAFQSDQHTVKEAILGPIGLRPGVPVVVLASSIKLNQISSLFAAAPLRVEHLKFKGKGDSPFYRTLLDYISSHPKMDTEELQWFLGNFLIRNTSIGSLAFAKRKQEYVELGQYAHALAQGKPDEIRVVMDFLSGRLGTPQGFEPFFDDVFQLGSLSEDTIEELRILAGTTTLGGPRLDLGMILVTHHLQEIIVKCWHSL